MKLFCFFITIAIAQISANDEVKFIKQVARTNVAIELAYNKNDLIVGDNVQLNGLEYVIEKIINNDPSSLFHLVDYYESFAKINFMIAVPDMTELFLRVPGMEDIVRHLPHAKMSMWKELQIRLHHEICTLGIDAPENEVGQVFGSLNLTTVAEQRRRLIEPAFKNILRRELGSMYDHFINQLEIRDTSNTEGLNLTTLTEVRKVTGRPLKNKIIRVLGSVISKDDEDQRIDVSEDFEDARFDFSSDEELESVSGSDYFEYDEEQNRPAQDAHLYRMCQLMGLYLSTKFPTAYIREIEIDLINYTCILNEDNLQRRFKKFNGVWWQIRSMALGAANSTQARNQ